MYIPNVTKGQEILLEVLANRKRVNVPTNDIMQNIHRKDGVF